MKIGKVYHILTEIKKRRKDMMKTKNAIGIVISLILICLMMMSASAQAHAASYNYAHPVFSASTVNGVHFSRPKINTSKMGGYTCALPSYKTFGNAYTNGSYVYYTVMYYDKTSENPNKSVMYKVKPVKGAKPKKVKSFSDCYGRYADLAGASGNNMYYTRFVGAEGTALYRYDMKTKKSTKLAKDIRCFSMQSGRYIYAWSESSHALRVYDAKNKKWVRKITSWPEGMEAAEEVSAEGKTTDKIVVSGVTGWEETDKEYFIVFNADGSGKKVIAEREGKYFTRFILGNEFYYSYEVDNHTDACFRVNLDTLEEEEISEFEYAENYAKLLD